MLRNPSSGEDSIGSGRPSTVRFPWPKESDKIFEKRNEAKSPPPSASLDFHQILESMKPEADFYYREGYYAAALLLATEPSDSKHASLYYPMLYCFRHFVELSLKSLLTVYTTLAGEEPNAGLLRSHSLGSLWQEAKRLIDDAEGMKRSEDETGRVVDRCLNELNEADKSSQAFRYPTSTTGDDLREQLAPIDLPLPLV